ncbi:hypothetical protein ACFL18_01055 [Patescibacteria group bacterium]
MMKKSTKILHWFYKLSWKKMLGITAFALTIAVAPLSVRIATNPTRTRSEAALLPQPQPITQEFETPTGPPEIYLVDHFFGKTGDAVLVHGTNLGGYHQDSWVSLSGKKITDEDLVSWTGSYIEFKVPAEAKSGVVEISVLGKRTKWDGIFFVTDANTKTILSLKPEAENVAKLTAYDMDDSNELLVWFLVVKGDGSVKLTPESGVNMTQKVHNFSVGTVYEANLKFSKSLAAQSTTQAVPLLSLQKGEDQIIGIARGEMSNSGGVIMPLQADPLYVTF